MNSKWSRGKALLELLQSRASAMPLTARTAEKLSGLTEAQLLDRLAETREASRRRPIGLMIALVIAEEAAVLESEDRVDDSLFRFAHHLREAASDRNQPLKRRSALCQAALRCFVALRHPPTRSVDELHNATTGFPSATDQSWKEATGLTKEGFQNRVEQATGTLRKPQAGGIRTATDRPTWLNIPESEPGNPFLEATANWTPAGIEEPLETLQDALERSWLHFEAREFDRAAEVLSPIRNSLGVSWRPTGEVASVTLWNWLRLVQSLAGQELGNVPSPQRLALGAINLATKLPLGQYNLVDPLERVIFEDSMVRTRPDRQWATLVARYTMLVGHERLSDWLDNRARAALREAWTEIFPGLGLAGSDSTAEMHGKLRTVFRDLESFRLRIPSEATGDLLRELPRAVKSLLFFCDSRERVIVDQVSTAIRGVSACLDTAAAETSVSQLAAIDSIVGQLEVELAASHSVFLQDWLAPVLVRLKPEVEGRRIEVEATATPAVRVTLENSRLPLQASNAYAFGIPITVANDGPVPARTVEVHLESDHMQLLDATAKIGDLRPGSEVGASLSALSGCGGETTELRFNVTWSDDHDRDFTGVYSAVAETQRPSQWDSKDANPFQLGSIATRDRLVGRDTELQTLSNLIRALGSTYLTGHKRVGKTSIVKVLLQELGSRGYATAFLPLGQALGPTANAHDLVFAMLDRLHSAIMNLRPDLTLARPNWDEFRANFAIAGGNWLKDVSSQIASDAAAVIAVDDFDELPKQLLKGKEGEALFLFLRSLVDEPWLSLVLIGSEVLPTLIGAQSYKLNQVSETKVGSFVSRQDTANLLELPTTGRLDWDPHAIDDIHSECAGNPYFATLVGQSIWDAMRRLDRTFVQPQDATGAIRRTADNADRRHFLHFWADSPEGLDPTAETALVAAAVLRSTARCSGDTGVLALTQEVTTLALSWLPGMKRAELGVVLGTLVNRGVLSQYNDPQHISVSLPLLGRWLRHGGAAYLDMEFEASRLATPNQYVVAPGDLVSICKSLFYCGERVNEMQVSAWLQQFGVDERSQWLAFLVLQRLATEGYFSPERLQRDGVPGLATAIRSSKAGAFQKFSRPKKGQRTYLENWYLLRRDSPGSSADPINRSLSAELKIRKSSNFVTLQEMLTILQNGKHEHSVLLIVDDFAGTGTQLRETVGDVTEQLSKRIPDWRERCLVIAGACIASDGSVLDEIREDGVDVAIGTVAGERLRAFDPGAEILASHDDTHAAKDLFESVGRSLVKNAPLGYGGDGLLVLFPDNCPNNTLPAFWAAGSYRGEAWTPLFERRW